MKLNNDRGVGRFAQTFAGRYFWIILIITSGTCLSPIFACVTPFAALATLSASKLGLRDAMATVGLVWATNQAIGYGVLGYPWTWDSVAWGLAIGASAALAMLAARALSTTVHAVPLAVSLPFMAAFTAFEAGLYLAGFVLPGSDNAFTASVVGQVFLVNLVALCGLMAAANLAIGSGLIAQNNGSDPLTVGLTSSRS